MESSKSQAVLQWFHDNHVGTKEDSWKAEKEKILRGPFDYLQAQPGKNIREQLIEAFNVWMRIPNSSLSIIKDVVNMLHGASLLIDDVEDNSSLRRGKPAAHTVFGCAQTINTANYVYFLALERVSSLPHAASATQVFITELVNLHRGQGMELYWRETMTCPTEEDYLEMASNKTGGLFRLAIRLMQEESAISNVADFISLATNIGVVYQILDDLLNLTSSAYNRSKGFCEDLSEGKFGFPLIRAIRSDPQNKVLMNIFKLKTTDLEVKKQAVSYIELMGGFADTETILSELMNSTLNLVSECQTIVGGQEGIIGADKVKQILGSFEMR